VAWTEIPKGTPASRRLLNAFIDLLKYSFSAPVVRFFLKALNRDSGRDVSRFCYPPGKVFGNQGSVGIHQKEVVFIGLGEINEILVF